MQCHRLRPQRRNAVVLFPVFLGFLRLACADDPVPPYPPSPVIKEIAWSPAATVVRRAVDGDNWPVTWADDDAIYTTWGDGTGFEPKVERKLSCGFARVTGSPEAFTGVNKIGRASCRERGERAGDVAQCRGKEARAQ